MVGDEVLEKAATVGRGLSGLEEAEILDEEGDAAQGPFGRPGDDGPAGLVKLSPRPAVSKAAAAGVSANEPKVDCTRALASARTLRALRRDGRDQRLAQPRTCIFGERATA
jgi:hypothetical protein